MSKVAIVTRSRNRLNLLQRAVESVLSQTWDDWVHVVINDGGEASALDALLAGYSERYGGRLQVIHHEVSQGMQNAANAGIAASESEYVCIHDDDDSWHPEFLFEVATFLNQEGPESLYQGVITHTERVWETIPEEAEDDEARPQEIRRELYLPLEEVSVIRLGYENPFAPIAFCYRRRVHEQIGFYEERFGPVGDLDFNFRFLQHFEIGVIPKVRAYYHWREGGKHANTVTAGRRLHAQKLLEFRNAVMRPGEDPSSQIMGLGINLSRFAVENQWMTTDLYHRLIRLDQSWLQAWKPELEKRFEDAREHMDAMSAALEGLRSGQSDHKGHLADLSREHGELLRKMAAYDELGRSLFSASEDQSRRLQALLSAAADAKEHLNQVSFDQQQTQSSQGDLKRHLNVISAELERLLEKANHQVELLGPTLQTQNGDLKTHLNEITAQLSDLKVHLNSVTTVLEHGIGVLGTRLEDQKLHLGQHSSALGDLKAHLGQHSSALGDLKAHLGQHSSALGDLKAHLEDISYRQREQHAALTLRVLETETKLENDLRKIASRKVWLKIGALELSWRSKKTKQEAVEPAG